MTLHNNVGLDTGRRCQASGCNETLDPQQIANGEPYCSEECEMITLTDRIRGPKSRGM